ncbi:MAG: DUF362 domain-containing protein [Planctomycetes bacterium]|nr:DUF362 domain-containing protein [Planctomycetota bacterium]
MPTSKAYRVRAARCDHRSTDEEIYRTLRRITDPLERSWSKLEAARKIVIKFNTMMPPDRIVRIEGRRQELVDDSVTDAVLRLLRERTKARIVMTDTTGSFAKEELNIRPILERHGVEYVESNLPPFALYDVPGGGLMFTRYQLSAVFKDADAVVSVAKMKNHAFMGITLCCKNLFGLPPYPPHGHRARTYFHHVIRLSYVLPDLGRITQPCLNIIDALTGQAGCEWGGQGRVCNALIAGDHIIATDACGMWLMGHDPASDWPRPPFRRDRNHILIAAQHGFGTVRLDDIDFETEVEPPLAAFDSNEVDREENLRILRRTACEQGLYYRDHRPELASRFAGSFIYLQEREVVWNGPDPSKAGPVQKVSAGRNSAVWLKKADPEEVEGEHFEVYEDILKNFPRS